MKFKDKSRQLGVLFLITFLCLLVNVFSSQMCYFCLSKCDSPIEIEKCNTRYGKQADTKCIAAETTISGGLLVRKQCILTNQSQQFCDKFADLEDVNCYICDEDLCNSSKETSSSVVMILTIVIAFVLNK
ncbi:hypothetical protein Zmor_001485 [Zophobas morio]|uniref:Protein quiver n=1 Tax=Zophobas morio TaxID=2755281 RepID=A0AA38IZ67_9CUCU|nr:hypothetical protein Zmor_001485 [Zophobas morio]